MGEKNDVMYEYLGNPAVFADFVNVCLFEGKGEIQPENVKEYSELYHAALSDRGNQKKYLKRERDHLRKIYKDCQYVVIGEENQDELHPFMPLRCLEYDIMEYNRQTKKLKAENRKNAGLKNGEYLAKLKQSDQLVPVVTIVFYHGKKPYDSCKTLHDMLDFSGENAKYKPFAADYKMNLVTLDSLDETLFETGLRELVGVMKRSDDKQRLKVYCDENRERLENLDIDTYNTISVMINQRNLQRLKKTNQENGGVNMCKAIEDMIEDGRIEGKLEGKFDERINGIRRQRKKGYATAEIADNVDMEEDSVNQIIELIEKKPDISNEEIISSLELITV